MIINEAMVQYEDFVGGGPGGRHFSQVWNDAGKRERRTNFDADLDGAIRHNPTVGQIIRTQGNTDTFSANKVKGLVYGSPLTWAGYMNPYIAKELYEATAGLMHTPSYGVVTFDFPMRNQQNLLFDRLAALVAVSNKDVLAKLSDTDKAQLKTQFDALPLPQGLGAGAVAAHVHHEGTSYIAKDGKAVSSI